MKSIFKKYFILIWLVFVAIYHLVVFLLFNQFAKDVFEKASFWTIYGCMMFAFLVWFITGLLERNTKFGGISPILTFIYPYIFIIFLMTTIMLFFVKHILLVFIIIPFGIISAIFIILIIFAMMNREWIKKNPQKVLEVDTTGLFEAVSEKAGWLLPSPCQAKLFLHPYKYNQSHCN